MTVLHLTVTNDNVLRRGAGKLALTPLATVIVTSTLDSYTVVTSIEEAVFYQYTVATLRVTSVTVRTVIVDMYTFYCYVFRE